LKTSPWPRTSWCAPRADEFRHVLETTWRTYRDELEKSKKRTALEEAVLRQTRRVRRTYLSAITSLARTMEERDPYTAGHSRRVRDYALALAHAIGLERKQRRLLDLAAQLHDIGKVAVPDAILHKPGPLTAEEYDVVRQHPGTGERILAPVVRNRAVLAAIRGHHERLDGDGYPDRLRGTQIPLLARLIAIPDCFDALTTSRAYRAAVPVPRALEMLREGAGSHFDPDFIPAFLQVVARLGLADGRLDCLARG
jgi:HD-GYP domain-containing protein (c-di-GMP phosphodiesterase class II)